MKYGEHFTITKAVAIVHSMKVWKEKNKDNKNVVPADYNVAVSNNITTAVV